MTWQGVAVLSLLLLPLLPIKTVPRDLRFTLAALFTSLLGITEAKQLFAAGMCQPILAVMGLWIFAQAWRWNVKEMFFLTAALVACALSFPVGTLLLTAGALQLLFRPKILQNAFPLPLCLELFSACIFYMALQTTGLFSSGFTAALLPLTVMMPRPIAFALLFACASAWFPGQLYLAGASAAIGAALPLFYRYFRPATLANS